MITKCKTITKRFQFRVKPHEVMKEEYSQDYYKFHNEKVAKAFCMEAFGHEVKVDQLKKIEVKT